MIKDCFIVLSCRQNYESVTEVFQSNKLFNSLINICRPILLSHLNHRKVLLKWWFVILNVNWLCKGKNFNILSHNVPRMRQITVWRLAYWNLNVMQLLLFNCCIIITTVIHNYLIWIQSGLLLYLVKKRKHEKPKGLTTPPRVWNETATSQGQSYSSFSQTSLKAFHTEWELLRQLRHPFAIVCSLTAALSSTGPSALQVHAVIKLEMRSHVGLNMSGLTRTCVTSPEPARLLRGNVNASTMFSC